MLDTREDARESRASAKAGLLSNANGKPDLVHGPLEVLIRKHSCKVNAALAHAQSLLSDQRCHLGVRLLSPSSCARFTPPAVDPGTPTVRQNERSLVTDSGNARSRRSKRKWASGGSLKIEGVSETSW